MILIPAQNALSSIKARPNVAILMHPIPVNRVNALDSPVRRLFRFLNLRSANRVPVEACLLEVTEAGTAEMEAGVPIAETAVLTVDHQVRVAADLLATTRTRASV